MKSTLIAKPSTINNFWKPKWNLMVINLQVFIVKKFPNHTCLAVISLDSALKKNDNYYLQVFLKECKYIEKKVIRNINDILSDFSSSNKSDEE